jgi:hypothetical protein
MTPGTSFRRFRAGIGSQVPGETSEPTCFGDFGALHDLIRLSRPPFFEIAVSISKTGRAPYAADAACFFCSIADTRYNEANAPPKQKTEMCAY